MKTKITKNNEKKGNIRFFYHVSVIFYYKVSTFLYMLRME